MIDTKAPPLNLTLSSSFQIPVAARTALLFNMLALAAMVLATLLPLAVLAYWLLVDPAEALRGTSIAPAAMPGFAIGVRIGAALVSMLSVLPLAWGLTRLRACFSEFALGRPFAARGIAGLRDFATAMVIAAIAKPLSFTLLTLWLSWNAPQGQRQLAIQIDSDTLIMALFAATIASLAWAMERAAAVAEENSQFV